MTTKEFVLSKTEFVDREYIKNFSNENGKIMVTYAVGNLLFNGEVIKIHQDKDLEPTGYDVYIF